MKTHIRMAAALGLISLGLLWPRVGSAQPFPSLYHWELDAWGFDDTNWLSVIGYGSVSATNVDSVPGWDGNALQINSSNGPAWLSYNIVEDDDTTNLMFSVGSLELWVLPQWTNGPGVWGRLIDVGACSTNSPSSWWSLYFSPDGSTLNFSSETNGVYTNYLNCAISWDTNAWHFIVLTYDQSQGPQGQSQLYLDGQLAASGTAANFEPDTNTPGVFYVGSDSTGTNTMNGQIDDLASFNYVLSEQEVTNHYAQGLQIMSGGGSGTSGDGGGGTNGDQGNGQQIPGGSGTALALTIAGVSNQLANLRLVNSAADILYEIQGRTNLLQGGWVSQGFVYGSELTNWTPAVAFATNRGTMFYRVRSWQDDTGTGVPTWWWLQYFGQITNVGANASAAGDSLSNMQKYQMGLNPTVFYNPNAPGGFYGYVGGSNVFLVWQPSPGPVTYSIQRGILDTNTGLYTYSQVALLSSNATGFEDAGVLTNSATWNNSYQLEATYPGASVTATDVWQVSWYVNSAGSGPPSGPPLPGNVYAWLDWTGTNVLLAWSGAQGATNYLVQENGVTVAQVGTNVASYELVGAGANASMMGIVYAVTAVYPGGGLSGPGNSYLNLGSAAGPAGPTNFYGYADGTGTDLYLTWQPVAGASGYIVIGGIFDYDYWDDYVVLGSEGAGTNSLVVPGAIDGSGNNLYEFCAVMTIYPGGNLSQAALWYSDKGAPAPQAFSAYLDWTGTNVVLSWSAAQGAVTSYVLQRSTYYGLTFDPLGEVGSGSASYVDVDGVTNDYYGLDAIMYEIQATYANGGLSPPVTATIATAPPPPTGLTATVSGTNILLSWAAATGVVSNYIIERGTYNAATGYSYSPIATVSAGTSAYMDAGAMNGGNANNNIYEVVANYGNGQLSAPDSSALNFSGNAPTSNLSVSANLVRNEAGRWQLMISGIPADAQAIAFYWYTYYYWDDIGPFSIWPPYTTETDIAVSGITNGIYPLPDYLTTNWLADSMNGKVAMVQPIGTDGRYGQLAQAGFQPYDSPVWVDGRQHLKQNILYQLRSATESQPNAPLSEINVWEDPWFINLGIPTDTNYVESSIFHWSETSKGYGSGWGEYIKMDDVWPISANYELHANLYDPDFSGTNFVWQPNALDASGNLDLSFQGTLASIPAPPVLSVSGPYWTAQTVFGEGIDPITGLPYPTASAALADLGAYTNNGSVYLQNGVHNLFGLYFQAALVNENPQVTLDPGGSVALTNCSVFYSQTFPPLMRFADYYFAPVNTPGSAARRGAPAQAYPLPCALGFANTNQTGLIVASVGTPGVVGGWARYSVQNSTEDVYAYLGQYFVTNALVITNGILTTNTTGVVSPYGDFFPTEPGIVALRTMPDIDTGAQGTAAVCVVSLNVDANHDGTMDFTWNGPDFVSTGKPFKFWVNDNADSGDYGGDGIPGQGAQANGVFQLASQSSAPSYPFGIPNYNAFWSVHGRRDLVDFFPVCLNIGDLFQSNAWFQGISPSDTSYQFVLSQADGALRFAYAGLTPTIYMNFLLDTNISGLLSYAPLTTISNAANGGVVLPQAFLSGIAASNANIILVEAWEPTTQPLVLTIYHGSNQIAQAQLPLSISGVEQMFRHKNLMLDPNATAPADRLTDASVPNEPDTIDKNFVFLHGYNVNTNEARGVAADMFKRMYWSGSHARFYAVTWQGADSKGTFPFYNKLTPNYHTNVVNAFLTAPNLANFIATLTSRGPVVVSAHSLGNMVVLSSISDWNAPINQYFMLDAAVPVEAIDPTAVTNFMVYSTGLNDWPPYTNRLYASYWHQLFPANDYRSTLNWNNRLGNLGNVDVYNFYSSGEEVLRTYTNDPPSSVLGKALTQITDFWAGIPFGTYTWYWQEKGKGTCSQDWFLGSSHGGWKMNYSSPYLYLSNGLPAFTSPAQALTIPNSQLMTNAFFDVTSTNWGTADLALYGSSGSSYAQANRSRLMADVIPAMSVVVGANPVPSFDNNHNKDMMTLENGWAQGRLTSGEENNNWHHSDFVQMAYTFTHELFDTFVTTGNLK